MDYPEPILVKAKSAHRHSYEEDGVVHIKGAVDPHDVERLREAVAEQQAGLGVSRASYDFEEMQKQAFSGESSDYDFGNAERFDTDLLRFIVETDSGARPLRDTLPEGIEEKGQFFHSAAAWRWQAAVRDVALKSGLPAIVTDVMDTEFTHFWEDTTFVKEPATPQRTAFHQDWSYFQIDGEKCCIVWIALDPTDAENGRMEYVRGSHRWGQIYAPNIFFAQSASPISPYETLPDIEGHRDDYDIVAFDCEPGDVIIHHVMTVHGSGGNISADRQRRAVSLRYCGDDIRYFDKPGAIEQQFTTAPHVNGDRLNPLDYPIVWPKNKATVPA